MQESYKIGVEIVLEIRLRNFYSIKEEVVFDLRAGALRTKSALDLEGNSFEFGKDQFIKELKRVKTLK